MKGFNIDELSLAALDITSVSYDWSKGYCEKWESYEATRCDNCRSIVTSVNPQCEKCKTDYSGRMQGPMMNYYYPLPCFDLDPEEAAKRLVGVCLALVHFTDSFDEDHEWALALTGGGMDLRWEICEAFCLLDYVPPAHFWDLPQFSGKTMDTTSRQILQAIRKGIKCRKHEVYRSVEKIRTVAKYLNANGITRRIDNAKVHRSKATRRDHNIQVA